MTLFSVRLSLGLTLLGVAGSAAAQQVAPPNIHVLMDLSGSMRELPQVRNSEHSTFFNETTSGCFNPKLDAMEVNRGWNPDTLYPQPDVGTGLGSDTGFPNLFLDDKFYGYMYWADSSNPPYQWTSKEQACQDRIVNWATTEAAAYNRCVSCLSLKGYWKLPGAMGRDVAPVTNLDFVFSGRFLNFNPPKYVTAKAALKSALKDMQGARVGMSVFTSSGTLTSLAKSQNSSCLGSVNDASAFDAYRSSYINTVNGWSFTTGTPLAKSLLNVGYYFTSDDSVYQSSFGFGTSYTYPLAFKNAALTSDTRSVCWGCQTNAVIIVSDGEPSGDSFTGSFVTIASKLRLLNGGPVYCPDSQPCASGPLPSNRDKGSDAINPADDNPQYYLDDVARLLYTQDLQRNTPDVVGAFDTYGQQRLTTYAVGYGIDSNLLRNTAAEGGGLYFTADTGAALKQALQTIISDVQTRGASCLYTPPPAP